MIEFINCSTVTSFKKGIFEFDTDLAEWYIVGAKHNRVGEREGVGLNNDIKAITTSKTERV